ncbi:MAG: 4Fe-4S binding protein [Chloroflexota bacterium]
MRHRIKLNFQKPEGEISRRELLNLVLPSYAAVPFGKLSIDDSRCSGCWLCATECPTGALAHSLDEIKDTNRLAFRLELCDACGKCTNVCPEKCLQLEHISELERMDSPSTVLFEDEIARCRECGSNIGSKAMIERLRNKVPQSLSSRLELCPVCKMKT